MPVDEATDDDDGAWFWPMATVLTTTLPAIVTSINNFFIDCSSRTWLNKPQFGYAGKVATKYLG
jgi:hypothetical protein